MRMAPNGKASTFGSCRNVFVGRTMEMMFKVFTAKRVRKYRVPLLRISQVKLFPSERFSFFWVLTSLKVLKSVRATTMVSNANCKLEVISVHCEPCGDMVQNCTLKRKG